MKKLVRETTAGAAISAFVILNKAGAHVATVNAHYSNGGRVTVDVWNHGDAAIEKSLATAIATGAIDGHQLARACRQSQESRAGWGMTDDQHKKWAAFDLFGLQQGAAGGYGYDKFAAAIAGLIIDGHTIANHCGAVPECERARKALFSRYVKAAEKGDAVQRLADRKAQKIGAHFANWSTEKNRFTSLHFEQGLKRLACFGYKVIQAI